MTFTTFADLEAADETPLFFVEPRGDKPVSREYKNTMAFMAATFRDDKPLTDEERDELIRKAGGR